MSNYDVIVIGGGHAGCESAHAAARLGSRVALVTMKKEDIGQMSCNPAIGGIGKSHLAREVDALDGLMCKVADSSALQCRKLNARKGPAVQATRVQTCRNTYKQEMLEQIRRLRVRPEELMNLIGKSFMGGCLKTILQWEARELTKRKMR